MNINAETSRENSNKINRLYDILSEIYKAIDIESKKEGNNYRLKYTLGKVGDFYDNLSRTLAPDERYLQITKSLNDSGYKTERLVENEKAIILIKW